MQTVTAEEVTGITREDVVIAEERTWIDESYSRGITGAGQEIVIIESVNGGTEFFTVDTETDTQRWMLHQMAESMRVTEEPTTDITFSWPANRLDVDFAATRTDSRTGAYYSVVRVGDRIEIEEHDDAESALVSATQGAIDLAHALNESGDDVKQLGAPHILARAYEARARMWRTIAGGRMRAAKHEGIIGRAGQITATDLAVNLGGSRALVNKILAGEDWM
ncbi:MULTISPECIES: hypothetical protein [unclassified Streptomyces]|uniref:hypothetical protein n=1 Tax=unclassified Streptomyces TaxID=2593676 RepID=UPI002E146457|nr:hypothetical protein OG279_39010 [Streptomyces sp. NBC_01201]